MQYGRTRPRAKGDSTEPDEDVATAKKTEDLPLAHAPNASSTLSSQTEASSRADQTVAFELPLLLSWAVIILLIFGGCCSNVFALEAIIKADPNAGMLLTFAQFILVVAVTLPQHISLSSQSPWLLKKRAIPLWRWIPSIVMFFAVNMLNNYAFGYRISVPVHIIVRSGGSVLTLLVGWISGKTYSRAQVLGTVLLSVGVVTAALADAISKGKPMTAEADSLSSMSSSAVGFAFLFLAALLSAIMGLYVQITYAKYGPYWQENLFYSHFLSIPLFLPFYSSLRHQFDTMRASPPVLLSLADFAILRPSSFPVLKYNVYPTASFVIPERLFYLFLNAATQLLCIRGVNLLAARTSALGVTIVLNMRKLVSLLLSIWLFGNDLPVGVIVGAAIVFTGAGVYALGDQKPKKPLPDKAKTEDLSRRGSKAADHATTSARATNVAERRKSKAS